MKKSRRSRGKPRRRRSYKGKKKFYRIPTYGSSRGGYRL